MVKYQVSKGDKILEGTILLPSTKSINYRVLKLRAIHSSKSESKLNVEVDEGKIIDDTLSIKKLSRSKDFGKAVRYIRAFFNYFHGEWVLSGIEKESNAVSSLVKKLQKEGINIRFEERQGNPPLKVVGKNLKGLFTRVEGSVSGKMINASLMIAPNAPSSIIFDLKEKILKSSYIDLSLKALHYLGVNTDWNDNETLIEHELDEGSGLTIEADWNAASYWYAMAAVSEMSNFTIQGLNEDSIQCDSVVKDLFKSFGVKTEATSNGLRLTKSARKIKRFEHDFTNHPDLIQTFIITCIVLKIPFKLKGVTSFLAKYENIDTLFSKTSKLGATITLEKIDDRNVFSYNGKNSKQVQKTVEISTSEDHRIVMAYMPVCLKGATLIIDNPVQTSKSYPTFWDDIKKSGFKVEVIV